MLTEKGRENRNVDRGQTCVSGKTFGRGKTLAAYILAHGMEIAKYSTRSLAEVTYTSPLTVLRLCKSWFYRL